ncbi:hypothetical protein T265_11435 [Opisthorchis viverrini]|uniref:Polyprenal reductase n=1 Tax=Opisthorchis viverrini TaxID=6198 RepID=A0A074ZXG7_OPIVI|nr:hypothetical protein T265_11435 [Opisthorchis viverrini]KER19894.1 hypothetical protein T265_11435 [Opisthorchis viverrini]
MYTNRLLTIVPSLLVIQHTMFSALLVRIPKLFTGIGLGIFIVSLLYIHLRSKLPAVLEYSFVYGKWEPRSVPGLEVLRVPKSWFTSFYISGTLAVSFFLVMEIMNPVPHPTVLCALTLLLTHLVRRLYESKCISVYGRSRMSFTHLILGISFYLVVPAAIYASRTSASLAQPVADQYFEPRGRMFKHIVCPHFLFEMAMYLSLHLLLCTSWIPFSHMVIFVLVNQSCSAWLSYHWYLERFPKWTSNRYVLIPYIW